MVTKVNIRIQDQDVVEMEVGTSGLSACNHSFNSPTASVCYSVLSTSYYLAFIADKIDLGSRRSFFL